MLEHHMNSDTPLWLNNTTGEAQTSRSVHICSVNRTLCILSITLGVRYKV